MITDNSENKRDIAYKAMVSDSLVYACLDYDKTFELENGEWGDDPDMVYVGGTVGCVLLAGRILSMSPSTVNFLSYARDDGMEIIDSPMCEILKIDIDSVFQTRNDAFVKASEILQL